MAGLRRAGEDRQRALRLVDSAVAAACVSPLWPRGRTLILEVLPIDEVMPALTRAALESPCVVLKAPTGAGKTTRVPPALLDAGVGQGGQIVVLEPRRLAARAAAARIARERGWSVGQEVGYQIRFERRASAATRLLIVTEGVLVRMLQDDPFLEGIGAVVFDEFHERSLHVDLALAMARRVQQEARPDLRLIVMSATLDPEPIAAWLGGCPVVESRGRLFPVDIRHAERASDARLPEQAVAGVRAALGALAEGDVLVFLPGVGEIRRAAGLLGEAGRGLEVLQLYGDLGQEAQDAILNPEGSRRRVILSTNVAETSLTIPGVRVVVDTGVARSLRHDLSTGLDRLELRRISKASADQRAGRAGRLGPGICLRLWTEREHRALADFDEAEIKRVDLAGPALELLAWGEASLADFPWFEAPEPAALARAQAQLRLLGAVDHQGVTALGRQMVRWPVHPRLSRLMIEGGRLGHLEAATWLAALLAERDPFLSGGPRSPDALERLRIVRVAAGRGDGRLHAGGLRTIERAQAQLAGVARRSLGATVGAGRACGEAEGLSRALLSAFPDRVARSRGDGQGRAVMVGGKGVQLDRAEGFGGAGLFIAVDLDAGPRGERAEASVRQAAPIERAWLPEAEVERAVEVAFDAERGLVVAVERVRYRDLVLEERPASRPDPEEASALLAAEALKAPEAAGLDEPEVAALLGRVRCLAGWMPELELPTFHPGAGLEGLFEAASAGRRSLAELRRAPWEGLILGALTWEQRSALDREAPERIEVPSGSRIKLQYAPGFAPVLAVRIQEVFGMPDTPRVAGGRVPVVMHLLAPNMRPQQVTQDLRSFWGSTYLEVRKELRQRYPKHAWPEDPWSAPPERRPVRRRG